jgi:hypothetical protein
MKINLLWIIFQFLHRKLQVKQVQFPGRIVQSLDRQVRACDQEVHECNLCKIQNPISSI